MLHANRRSEHPAPLRVRPTGVSRDSGTKKGLDIRLIATDLDGTLLDDSRAPHPRAAEALRRAHSEGLAICLASGRVASGVRRFAGMLELPCWIVACNGAHVLDPAGTELRHTGLAPGVRDAVLAFAEDEGCHLNLYSREQVVCLVEGPLGSLYRSRVRNVLIETPLDSSVAALEPTKMMLVAEPDRVPIYAAIFAKRFGPEEVSITISEAEYLEFLPPGVNKSAGLEVVAAALQIRAAQVAAIGDYHNDIEMLRWAGFSGATANAAPEAKAAAGRLFPANVAGGCADFVDAILGNLR